MANDDRKANAGLVVGLSASAAAIVLALRKQAGVAPGGIVSLDDATMQLLVTIAAQTGKIDVIIEAINNIALTGGVAVVPNADTIRSTRLQIAALNTPYQLPDVPVPDTMELLIKGWPGNFGIIYIAENQPSATNINQVWPIIANELVAYKVKNANCIWVSGTVVGDFVGFTVEQRSG